MVKSNSPCNYCNSTWLHFPFSYFSHFFLVELILPTSFFFLVNYFTYFIFPFSPFLSRVFVLNPHPYFFTADIHGPPFLAQHLATLDLEQFNVSLLGQQTSKYFVVRVPRPILLPLAINANGAHITQHDK